MKNLAVIDLDKLEDVPTRSKMREGSEGRRHYRNWNVPYNRIHRFLNSRVGKSWDAVFSEFKTLQWVPVEHRTEKILLWSVEKNTVLKDGVVQYLDESYGDYRPINDGSHYSYKWHLFYIHPKTKKLCRREDRRKGPTYKERLKAAHDQRVRILGDFHQLVKVDGVWHEVKGEPVDSGYVKHNGLTYKLVDKANYVPPVTVESAQFENATKEVYPKILWNQTGPGVTFINGQPAVPERNTRYIEERVKPRDCLIQGVLNESFYGRHNSHGSVKIILYRQISKKELKRHGLSNDMKPALKMTACKVCGSFERCWHSGTLARPNENEA